MRATLKTTMAALIAVMAFAAMPSQASAWTCGARSPTGSWGLGWSPYLGQARRLALRHCAVNTRRGYWCHITYCT